MTSEIDHQTVTINPRAASLSTEQTDEPTATITPATENAPRGRIVDDSARGTIFWEADPSDVEASRQNAQVDGMSGALTDGEQATQDWGKPFRIEWMCTNRLPFYRTRGLRNPWNANREVKIARDGTELETSVGRRLLSMFHPASSMLDAPHVTSKPSANLQSPPIVVSATQDTVNADQKNQ